MNHWFTEKDHLVGKVHNHHLLQGNDRNHHNTLQCCSNVSEVIQWQNDQWVLKNTPPLPTLLNLWLYQHHLATGLPDSMGLQFRWSLKSRTNLWKKEKRQTLILQWRKDKLQTQDNLLRIVWTLGYPTYPPTGCNPLHLRSCGNDYSRKGIMLQSWALFFIFHYFPTTYLCSQSLVPHLFPYVPLRPPPNHLTSHLMDHLIIPQSDITCHHSAVRSIPQHHQLNLL